MLTKGQILKVTKKKRKAQKCRVFELKLDKSSLSIEQTEQLDKLFLEAKWFYNHLLNQSDIYNPFYRQIKEVDVKMADEYITRELTILSSQMKMGIQKRIEWAIKGLHELKKKGYDVGKIKFTKFINTIDLPQYKGPQSTAGTWWFTSRYRIKIQGFKKPFRVHGTKQFRQLQHKLKSKNIDPNIEFANAKLIRRDSGYYLHITTYTSPIFTRSVNKEVGLDFGIKSTITTSDNEIFNVKIPESTKLKNIQRKLAKTVRHSNNNKELKSKLRKEYEHISNQKKDITNKIVSKLVNGYDKIYIQDELISLWHKGWFGKQVQHSILGAIKGKLKTMPSTQVVVIESYHPTTKLCPSCLNSVKLTLDERLFSCPLCGFEEDRDVKASKLIMEIGKGGIQRTIRDGRAQYARTGFAGTNTGNSCAAKAA